MYRLGIFGAAVVGGAIVLGAVAGGCSSDSSLTGESPATSGSGAGSGVTSTGSGGSGGGGASSSGGAGVGGQSAIGGGGAAPGCMAPGDCDAKLGPAACGNWICDLGSCAISAAGCTDADHDGYGVGPNCACAGLDCDDSDAKITGDAVSACYSGPMGTQNVGVCHAGTKTCVKGVSSPCVGEVAPSGEACNGLDDDCNGAQDDKLGTFTCGLGECVTTVAACSNGKLASCVPKNPATQFDGPPNFCNGKDDNCDGVIDENCKVCVRVSPNGNDNGADGTVGKPFLTIQAAINYAAANANAPKLVCVAGGQDCNSGNNYQSPNGQTVTMSDGIAVVGSYESTNWNQCGQLTTEISPGTAAGLTFPKTVAKTTTLSAFRVNRITANVTSAITVDGAKNAVVATVLVNNNVNVQSSYGINVINGGDMVLTRSRIEAGTGSSESIALRSVASKVAVSNNCGQNLDATGHCPAFCGGGAGLRGRSQQGSGTSYNVLLDSSPGSTIETSGFCGVNADIGANVRVQGDGTGVMMRGNSMIAFGGAQHGHGVWVEDCKGAKPWIVDNFRILANGTNGNSATDGVRAIGDCHPVIDTNLVIGGGGEGNAGAPNGVHCAPNGQNVPSKCVVLGNKRIAGSQFGFPPVATGVRCDGSSCARVEQNLITGRGGNVSYGLFLQGSGAFVDNNEIRGGCSVTSTGVAAVDSYARLQNNRIFGYLGSDCGAGQFVGLQQS